MAGLRGGVEDRMRGLFSRGAGADRIAYYSDAVYAIAMTLLVVDLRIPEGAGSAAEVLAQEWPSYGAFVLSFVIIAVSWVGHHRRFRVIERFDSGLIVLNLVLLFGVVSVPFSTSLLADFAPQPPAVAVYAATVAFILIAQLVCWIYACRAGLVADSVDRAVFWAVVWDVVPTILVFLVSIPFALFVDGYGATYLWLALLVISPVLGQIVPRLIDRRYPPKEGDPLVE